MKTSFCHSWSYFLFLFSTTLLSISLFVSFFICLIKDAWSVSPIKNNDEEQMIEIHFILLRRKIKRWNKIWIIECFKMEYFRKSQVEHGRGQWDHFLKCPVWNRIFFQTGEESLKKLFSISLVHIDALIFKVSYLPCSL